MKTDHLSDLELYAELYDTLVEPTKDWAAVLAPEKITQPGAWTSHLDFSDFESADDESARRYAMYYVADDDHEQRRWLADMLQGPGPLPSHRTPPYDRDRFLPTSREAQLRANGVDDIPF